MKTLLLSLALLVAHTTTHAQPPVLGATKASAAAVKAVEKDYLQLGRQMTTDAPGKVEVIEFFHYGCAGCRAMDPALEKWVKENAGKAQLKRHALSSSSKTDALQKLFHTLEAMGVEQQYRARIFKAVLDDRHKLTTDKEVVALVQSLGINKAQFEKYHNSFSVLNKTRSGNSTAIAAGVTYVPSFLVNGRLLTTKAANTSTDKTLTVLSTLVKQESRSAATKNNRVK